MKPKAMTPAGSQCFFDTAGSKGHFHDLPNDVKEWIAKHV